MSDHEQDGRDRQRQNATNTRDKHLAIRERCKEQETEAHDHERMCVNERQQGGEDARPQP